LRAVVPERFESERLVYERIVREHADELASLMRDPDVMRTLWPSAIHPTEEQISSSLNRKVVHWERHGFGMWLLRERTSGEFLGRGGPQYTDVLSARAVEVGWAIVPARWGEGFATELAIASVDKVFTHLQLREVIAFTLPDNIASRRVMDKAGFAYEREIVHAGLPHVLYRCSAPRDMAVAGPHPLGRRPRHH
jgi:RimJ/RimL family protein N-acetyltransferase